ncbi:MAG: WbuC family cupin fold metalloprotein [Patescibacteria group bacterium]
MTPDRPDLVEPISDASLVTSLDLLDHEQGIRAAQTSTRGRALQTLHGSPDAPLHAMVNYIRRGSYIRPHRHWTQDGAVQKGESFVCHKGSGKIIFFDNSGNIIRIMPISAAKPEFILIPPQVYHTLVANSEMLIMIENKTGPYNPETDKSFHPAFPEEGSKEVEALMEEWLRL